MACKSMPSTVSLYVFFLCSCELYMYSSARDTIAPDTPIRDSADHQDTTIVSAGERFELGFFTPNGSSDHRRYVGIWYYRSNPRVVVWVANRGKPLKAFTGVFGISEGDLIVSDGNNEYYSTQLHRSLGSLGLTAKLKDSGNLVLSAETKLVWESFKNPTDTFLPGMKMDYNLKLTSWKSRDDPSSGIYTFEQVELEGKTQYNIQKEGTPYWTSRLSASFLRKTIDNTPSSFISAVLQQNFTQRGRNYTYRFKNGNGTMIVPPSQIFKSGRLVMDSTGELRLYVQSNNNSVIWRTPGNNCSVVDFCGSFGICNSKRESRICRCLKEFAPNVPENWVRGDFADGCQAKTPVGKDDDFKRLENMRMENTDWINRKGENESSCRIGCLKNRNCRAYAFQKNDMQSGGTLSAYNLTCFFWYNDLKNLEEEYAGGIDLYVRVGSSLPAPNLEQSTGSPSTRKSIPSVLLIVIATSAVLLLACTAGSVSYFWRRRVSKIQEARTSIQGNGASRLHLSGRRMKDLIELGQIRDNNKTGMDVPFYDFESILAATDYFSDANKLGQGGFGPVYMGKFPGGQEMAVKRLSSASGQGMEEFKNEVVLIAKLQHRNLVKLLGYCIEGDEKILIYEYMRNKSLDYFLFDRSLCLLLNWEMRFDIILGIARGLLYLHQDSRLRIIHRDLKTSNILLDEEMNPKISDFGLARIFGGKQTRANTDTVVGTYGYMSPEYALDGIFSDKSDVFSFGVVLLEIVSGKKNTGFYQAKHALSLIRYAWRLWEEDKALDLMDHAIIEACNTSDVLRCIIVGFLCVQEDPDDRPTMSNVVFMLGSETTSLPTPKQPAFVLRKSGQSNTTSSSSKPETCSINQMTITVEEGR